MAETAFATNHAKRNSETGAVALRTIFPDDDSPLANQAWLVATVNMGAHFARTSDVADWEDLYVPPAVEE